MNFLRKHIRSIALYITVHLVLQMVTPSVTWALTSGPSQPEAQQFSPAGMDNMVDPFTGDFSYNISLLDIGGYPVNINYASGVSPETESSWVGLGWNLNVGAINRSVRGLPDDFAGEPISKDFDIKPNQTYGVSGSLSTELFGFKAGNLGIGLSANLFYNNYNGIGMSVGVSPSVSAGLSSKSPFTGSMGLSLSLGSETGLEVSPTFGLSYQQGDKDNNNTLGTQIGFPYSTREGMKGMSMSGSFNYVSSGEHYKGIGLGAFQGFASPTYTPNLEHDKYNVNASLNLSFSATNPATEPSFGFGGYYSGQFLKSNNRTTPAYGYMYSGLDNSDDKLLDFNREKEGYYNKFTTNLAVPNYTYDIFQVNGQGTGGTYRLHRGDVGALHDPTTMDQGYSPSLGVEIGAGAPPSVKVGIDADFNYTQTYTGKWSSGRDGIKSFNSEESTIDSFKELVYFKKIGEVSPENDPDFLTNVQQGYLTMRHEMESDFAIDARLTGQYAVSANPADPQNEYQHTTIPFSNSRSQRRDRCTPFTVLTANDAKKASVSPLYTYANQNFDWGSKDDKSRSYNMSNPNVGYTKTEIVRDSEGKKGHHISEVRVTDNLGTRYVYGIPTYNNSQNEVTFSLPQDLQGLDSLRFKGVVKYNNGQDAMGTDNGSTDNYFNKVSTPAYATSYLLTAVLSSDYVDRDGIQGPSDGDLGSYTKFNYTRTEKDFNWRSPLGSVAQTASFSEGLNSTKDDDKANYVYGSKEIWYLHSIETRTHVAEFHLIDREDGLGADVQGNIESDKKLQALSKIVLYSKTDKYNSDAEPIKTIHFKYDYSLCPNTPNSNGTVDGRPTKGKLTLKEIWFTFGKSNKGLLNPYKFTYADKDFDGNTDAELNPDYGSQNNDRWGNYKKSDIAFPNVVFPYSVQDSATAAKNAASYALSSIQIPTGGTIRVYYEADDYGYVQNKQAMHMYKILGASNGDINTYDNLLFHSNLDDKPYLVIDLAEGFKPTTGNPEDEFRKKYLDGFDLVYYKLLQEVVKSSGLQEFVPGYFEIDKQGSKPISSNSNGLYDRALIKIKTVKPQNGNPTTIPFINPLVRNGWMFARLRLNRELFGLKKAEDNGLKQTLQALLSQAEELKNLLLSFNQVMKDAKNSQMFIPERSFLRLNDPDKKKHGGGHRVRAIVMEDNWSTMKSQQEKLLGSSEKEEGFYGQAYSYTMKEDNGSIISSGVATWEPMIGGEENPFRLPVYVREKIPLAPSKEYFLEEPFGESFFPAPQVGYRQVRITSLRLTKESLDNRIFTSNGTGYAQNEFYTAYDFPTIARRTDLRNEHLQPNIVLKFLKIDARDHVTCSQGYYVETNDMHGKQKAQRIYPEYTQSLNNTIKVDNAPLSEIEYRYLESGGRLDSKVPYVKSDLTLNTNGPDLGTDVDVVQDERFIESTTLGGGIQVNIKYIQVGIIPIFVTTAFPDFNSEQTRFRSIVTAKVVNRSGILKSVTVKDHGASIVTENLAWDQKSGNVLLTKVQNEFHDPIYKFTYPAHWAYVKMGYASSEEGRVFSNLGSVKASLVDGAELMTDNGLGYFIDSTNNEKIVDKTGAEYPFLPGSKVKVIRSGAHNMYDAPIGTITTLDDPRKEGKLIFTEVLDAGVNEFKEDWKRFCNCTTQNSPESAFNWITSGKRGNMRPFRSLTFMSERSQSTLNNNLNVRKDGILANFVPFWRPNANGGITGMTNSAFLTNQWQFVMQTENYNSTGLEIENKDALERYSMAQFGYSRNLPVAVSNNSKYRESGFDGFEDYDIQDCEDDHLSWRQYPSNVDSKNAHTGRKSIRLSKNSALPIEKVIVPCDKPKVEDKPYSRDVVVK